MTGFVKPLVGEWQYTLPCALYHRQGRDISLIIPTASYYRLTGSVITDLGCVMMVTMASRVKCIPLLRGYSSTEPGQMCCCHSCSDFNIHYSLLPIINFIGRFSSIRNLISARCEVFCLFQSMSTPTH